MAKPRILANTVSTGGLLDDGIVSASEINGAFPDLTVTNTATLPDVLITGGSIDGTTIGTTTPVAGTFTSLSSDALNVNGNDYPSSGPLSNRNKLINGNFDINQRGVSGSVTLAAGEYGHDRWKAGASGCTYTFATSGNVTTLTISAGSLIQVVEGVNLFSGTYVLSWAGTAQGKIGAGSFGNSGVTGSVTGGTNLEIEFGTGTLSKVQLEAGNTATPFEHRSVGQELALCQRYFVARNAFIAAMAYRTDIMLVQVFFPTTMRTVPSITATYSDMPSPNIGAITLDSFHVFTFAALSSTGRGITSYTASAEL